jgi:GNAT superfamily N-acetyltransferase
MRVRTNIKPGDIGQVIYLHGTLYAKEYDLDYTFEGYVAAGLGEFAKTFDERKDHLWLAEDKGRLVGSIAIAGLPDRTAQLRWFLVHPEARGAGLGRQLLGKAIEFCRGRGSKSIFLWTISELKAAAYLYQSAGFRLTAQKKHVIWGGVRTEERYDLLLQGE